MDSNRQPAVAQPAAEASRRSCQRRRAHATPAGRSTGQVAPTGRRPETLTHPQGHLPCTR
jgi:hypothetical protein